MNLYVCLICDFRTHWGFVSHRHRIRNRMHLIACFVPIKEAEA